MLRALLALLALCGSNGRAKSMMEEGCRVFATPWPPVAVGTWSPPYNCSGAGKLVARRASYRVAMEFKGFEGPPMSHCAPSSTDP